MGYHETFERKTRVMKSILRAIVGIFVMLLFGSSWIAFAQSEDTGWTIENFVANITLKTDTTVEVVEHIDVDFNTLAKHGIYRIIPVRFKTQRGDTVDSRFQLLRIQDQLDRNYRFEQTREGDSVKLKIGDPDRTVSGRQTYVIAYQVSRVIAQPHAEGGTEFYWNITGNGWPVPIRAASAQIRSPAGGIIDLICFTGYYGSTQENCTKDQDTGRTVATFSARNLAPSQGLTASVLMDSAQFSFPPPWKELLWFLRDNWLYGVPLLTLLVMLVLYWQHGRDKQYRNLFHESGDVETVPLFAHAPLALTYGPPPSGLPPGEVGVIVDEKIQQQDITAIVIDLARRGYFTIKELKQPSFFSKGKYQLLLQGKDEKDLRDYEESVMDMLFDDPRKKTVDLNSLHSDAYQDLEEAKKRLYTSVTKSGYFYGDPGKVRKIYFFVGFMLIVVGLYTLGVGRFLGSTGGWLTATMGSGAIVAAFSQFMPARTPKGRKALQEIVGLREWIRIGAWREQIHEKLNFFEEILPYTITFGLTAKFLKALEGANITAPSWYIGSGRFNANGFANSMNSVGSSVNSSVAATRPSGGGSGFGGGGFSGGGGGGGGGGSW